MLKIRKLSQRYPILFALVIFVLFSLMMRFGGLLFSSFPPSDARSFCQLIFGMLWPIGLTYLTGYGFIFRKSALVPP